MWVEVALVLVFLVLGLVAALVYFLHWIWSTLAFSIQPVTPAEVQSAGEAFPADDVLPANDANPLFRHLPQLKAKLAWEPLGVFPTPIHSARLPKADKTHRFWIKREDLNSQIYAGNKVRTLQYQLPACRAHLKEYPSGKVYVTGSGGSNQVVATLAHGAAQGLKFHVSCASGDYPDIDNTLNLLSTLSLGPLSLGLWDAPFTQLRLLLKAINSPDQKVFGAGGISIGGILGQMGGALEVAEQISRGEIPDVDEIYLPLGSGCTTSGLVLGVCLARHLKLNAFKSHQFKIVSVMIHHGFSAISRATNVMRAGFGKHFGLTPRYATAHTADYFERISGISLKAAAMDFYDREWDLVDAAEYAGMYGAHTAKSEASAAYADEKLVVEGSMPQWLSAQAPPQPWLCGHFAGKAFTVMIDRMEASEEKKEVLFWQTKSSIQPLGSEDEWTAMKTRSAESKALKKWAEEGRATSALRPGKVDLDKGVNSDYRGVMTDIRGNIEQLIG